MNTVKIAEKQQAACGIITEMNQVILSLLILGHLNTRQVLQEILGDGEAGYDANKVGKNITEVAIPLKHLSNFWRVLNIPLINCKVELILTWSKNCVLADMTVMAAQGGNAAIVAPTGLEFQITDTKLYVPVVTLSKENNTKLLEQLKPGFKRTIKWNKYRSQITVQPQNNNLNYLIDPTFTNVKRLFVLLFTRTNAGITETLFHAIMYQTFK